MKTTSGLCDSMTSSAHCTKNSSNCGYSCTSMSRRFSYSSTALGEQPGRKTSSQVITSLKGTISGTFQSMRSPDFHVTGHSKEAQVRPAS